MHWINWSLRTVDEERMVYASGRDVTQEWLAERALASSERRYRALVDGLPGHSGVPRRRRPAARVRRRPAPARRRGAAARARRRQRRRSAARPREPSSSSRPARPRWKARSAASTSSRPSTATRCGCARARCAARTGASARCSSHRTSAPASRATARSSEAQERFRRAFDDAPIGMAVAGLDGRFLEVNQALCTITGYPASELTGTTFTAITHPDDVDADFEVMRALIAGELASSVDEKRYLRPDGVDRVGRAQRHARARCRRRAAALPRPDPGHHRAPPLRARAAPPRRPRPADRACSTGGASSRRSTATSPRSRATARAARCSCSTSTTSSTSTTRSATTPATSSSCRSPRSCRTACARPTRSRASAATSSPCCCRTRRAARPSTSPRSSCRPFATRPTVVTGDRPRRVTTSVGVAPFGRRGLSGEELLIEADLAMYEAKEVRPRQATASCRDDALRPERLRGAASWLDRVRAALDDDRFVLHAQPIRDLRTGGSRSTSCCCGCSATTAS